ncbi:MAG: copper resistance protein NlpE N-terminal domain-containing protein [Saprospiraceae bacterium]|nr:copper resistance protein NlpE N-terminal domain-containing protein [Saprospiraceae bacterium]
MRIQLLFLSALLALAACTESGQPNTSQTAIAQKVAGQYQGVTPCADCDGIEYLLTLNSDYTYLGAMMYRGKAAAPVSLTGKWSFVADNKIKLDFTPPEGMNQFEIGENHLILLDQQGQRIDGEEADRYLLWKEGFAPQTTGTSAAADPFAERRAAGIDFVGLGTEPFWSLELDFEKNFRFVPMSGDSLELPAVAVQEKGGVWRYESKAGTARLDVEIKKETCSDGMSDNVYEYAVTLRVNGEEYKGCGILLQGALGK